jgi:hypothetical protein
MEPLTTLALLGLAGAAAAASGKRAAALPPPPTTSRPKGDPMSDAVIRAWAERNQVDPRWIRAIRKVEAGNLPALDALGRPIARFEVHHFFARLAEHGATPAAIAKSARTRFRVDGPKPWQGHKWKPTPSSAWKELHTGRQADEHNAIKAARGIARALVGKEDPALLASSWGIGQVLGRHYKTLGFPTVQAMVADASRGEGAQLTQKLEFMRQDKGGEVLAALRSGDPRRVAAVFNGSGQVDQYAAKLVAAGAPASAPRIA